MVITAYHIELYKRVAGDVDHLQRIGTPEEKSLENQDIIVEMKGIVTDLERIKKGLTSREYADRVTTKLKRICADDHVLAQMKRLKPCGQPQDIQPKRS